MSLVLDNNWRGMGVEGRVNHVFLSVDAFYYEYAMNKTLNKV